MLQRKKDFEGKHDDIGFDFWNSLDFWKLEDLGFFLILFCGLDWHDAFSVSLSSHTKSSPTALIFPLSDFQLLFKFLSFILPDHRGFHVRNLLLAFSPFGFFVQEKV